MCAYTHLYLRAAHACLFIYRHIPHRSLVPAAKDPAASDCSCTLDCPECRPGQRGAYLASLSGRQPAKHMHANIHMVNDVYKGYTMYTYINIYAYKDIWT